MSSRNASLSSVTTMVAIAALTGCSGGGAVSAPTSVQSQDSASFRTFERTGVAPKFLSLLQFRHFAPLTPTSTKGPKELAVSDAGSSVVDIFNSAYRLVGTISSGINVPDGSWYDGRGDLFVANSGGANVTQYGKGGTTVVATYSSGLTDPVDTKTDGAGNVYVADYGGGSASVVVEYAPGANVPSVSCPTGLANEGIAIDRFGNVFVSGNAAASGQGSIVEFAGGLSGCKATPLSITLGSAGGLDIDRKGELNATDQFAGIDVIAPPYSRITRTISTDGEAPFRSWLNKSNTLIFIAHPADGEIAIASYATGETLSTIGGTGILPNGGSSNPCNPPPPEQNPC